MFKDTEPDYTQLSIIHFFAVTSREGKRKQHPESNTAVLLDVSLRVFGVSDIERHSQQAVHTGKCSKAGPPIGLCVILH